jgi:hypothetical protein
LAEKNVHETTSEERSLDKMTLDEMLSDEMSLNKIIINKMIFKNSWRLNVMQPLNKGKKYFKLYLFSLKSV